MPATCTLDPVRARRRLASTGGTQTALARSLDVELRTLQRWFAGSTLRVDDAERVASALGVGTAELSDDLPPDAGSPFVALRSLLAILRRTEGPMLHAVRATLEHFQFVDTYLAFDAHPRHGFVRRHAIDATDVHRFHVLRITPTSGRDLRMRFAAQVARRFRYEFGEVGLHGDVVTLVEHFHTRSVCAVRRDDGSFDVHVWVPSEMKELVVVANTEFDVRALPPPRTDRFDLDAPGNRHALCFRPAAMHLRQAGLPDTFDRLDGSRDGRVDGLVMRR